MRRNKRIEQIAEYPQANTSRWKEELYRRALDNLEIPILVSGNTPDAVPVTHGPLASAIEAPQEPIGRIRQRMTNIVLKSVMRPSEILPASLIRSLKGTPTEELPAITQPTPA